MRLFAAISTPAFMMATPAHASSWVAIPEPSNLGLFALGLVGLIIGRQVAKRRNDRD